MTRPQGGSPNSNTANVAQFLGAQFPAPGNPMAVARQFVTDTEHLLIYYQGDWMVWQTSHWATTPPEDVKGLLWRAMEHSHYLDANGDRKGWNPTPHKINGVYEALSHVASPKEVLGLSEDVDPAGNGGWFGRPKDVTWLGDQPDRVIPFSSGLLRVADRTLLPFDPLCFNRYVLQCPYDPQAESKLWGDFVFSSFPPDAVDTVEEWGGYVLSGRLDLEKYLLLVGLSRSGKGTYVAVLEALLPDNAIQGLTASKFRDQFTKAGLFDKSLVIVSDSKVKLKNPELVEFLLNTVGRDNQTARPAYGRRDITAVMPGRIMVLSNQTPEFADHSSALKNRTLAVHMPDTFAGKEKPYKETLTRPEHLSGIANRFLDGLDRLAERGRFEQPESGEHLLGELSDMGSEIKQFVREWCVLKSDATVGKQGLYDHYRRFCEAYGFKADNFTLFCSALYAATENAVRGRQQRVPGSGGKRRSYVFEGIKLVTLVKDDE